MRSEYTGNVKTTSDDTVDLLRLARQVFTIKHIVAMIFAGIIFGCGAYAYSEFMLPELYNASVSMYVNSNESGYSGTSNAITNLTVSRNLVDSYVVVLSNDIVMEEIGAELLDNYEEEVLSYYFPISERDGEKYIKGKYISGCFTIEPVDNTEVLKISATTQNAQLSADLCNAMTKVAPGFLKRVVGAGSVEAIGAAVPPDGRAYPNNKSNATKGAMAGVALVCFAIVLKIMLDTKIRDTESFKEKFDYPIMGEIPLINTDDLPSNDSRNKKKPKKVDNKGLPIDSFTTVEAFNTLCNNLMITMTMNEEKIIVVSSPQMSDGKSTVALNMAKTMAKMGNKILLMDLDLRRPTVHKKLNIHNKRGFINLVSKTNDMGTVVRRDEESGLDYLTSGGISPNPSEVLASKRIKDVLEECKEIYDFIIIDSPPINLVPDACIISQMAAGVLVVLRANEARFEDFKRIVENIEIAKCKIVGVVINGVDEQIKKYGKGRYGYKYGYKYAYSYTSDDEKN